MGFLDGLFETKAAVPKNPLPRATGGTRSLGMSVAGASSWDIDQAITYGYERVIWVYRCVDTIASNAASIPIIEREYDDNTGQVVDDPPLMRLLNRRANPYETAQQFRYRLASQLLLSRRGAFIEVVRNNAGEPTALHLLPPGTTSPIIDPATYVSGYAVQTIAQGLVELPPDRVIWIRVKPHPTDVYAQMTPLVSAGLAVDTDFLARLYNRNFLANDGRPGLLVAVKGGINTEDAEELRRRFSGGPNGAGATSVIEADGIDVEDMGASPRDVMWADAVSGSKEDILLAFGTPESVLGNASGRCLASGEYVRLANGERYQAHELVGKRFTLLTSTPQGQVEVEAWATNEAIEPIYRVVTESGRQLEVNARHPLYAATYLTTKQARWRSANGPRIDVEGWTSVADLRARHADETLLLAVPTAFHQTQANDLTIDEAKVLGYLIGDGSISGPYIALTTPDGEMVKDFVRAVEAVGDEVNQYTTGDRVAAWGVRGLKENRKGRGSKGCNRTRTLLDSAGLLGTTSHTKFIPARVFGASTETQRAFLGALYACDGWLGVKSSGGAQIELDTVSHRLALDVQELLIRLGVNSRIVTKRTQGGPGNRAKTGVGYAVIINQAADVVTFCAAIDVPGKEGQADAALEAAQAQLARKPHGGNVHTWRTKHLDPDLRWEKIKSITPVGVDQTVGVAVPEHHTYLSTFWEHNTFANAATEEEVFWKATMVPFLDGVAAGFDILTPGGLDDENVVAHDYSTVEALQRQKKERDDRALNEVKAGTMTIDDYLEFVGREPMNVPGTKVLWTPPGLVPVGPDDATTQAAAALAPSGAGQAPPPGGAPPVPGQDMQQVATTTVNQALETQQRAIEDDNAARALRLAGKQSDPFVLARSEPVPALQTKATTDEYPDHPYQVARDITEAQIEAVLAAWSKRQSRVILARLTGTKARKHTRHWSGSPGTKALNSAYITNPEMWAEDLVESLTDVIGAMANTEALRMARQLRDDGVIDRVLADGGGHRPHARTPLDRLIDRDALVDPVRAVEDMIRNSALRQTELIAAHIRMRDAEGADMDTIAKEVDKMINSRSSWHKGLAVAAATTAMEGVRDTVMQAAGPHILRIWRTMRDERVRPTHRVAHGQRRATGRPFLVGGFPLMFPGDPSAPIHETANCFPAGTRVWASDVVGAYRSWYAGDIVTLRTANGNVITGTPNHPVLTPGGWAPIGLLHEGSDLIRTVIGDGAEGTGGVWGDPDVHNRPPVIDEVFDTLAKDRAPMRLPTVAVNFHGDRPAGDVDVVLSDRELRLALDPALLQHPGQLDLIGADPSSGPGVVDGLGASGPFGITHNSVPGRSVGRSGVGASFVSGHSAHAQEIGLTTRTPGDTGLTQAALDRLTVSPVGPSDGKFTLASHVATDHVVSVDVRPFVGHVYNLQTKSGMYAAQGIVVHNCRCWVDYRPQAVRRGGRRIPPSVRPRGTATPPRASRAGMLRAREMAA